MTKPNITPNEDNNGQKLGLPTKAWTAGYVTSVTDNSNSIINKEYLENYVSTVSGGVNIQSYTIETSAWTNSSDSYEVTFQRPQTEKYFSVCDTSGNHVLCDVIETSTSITLKSIAPFDGELQMISTKASDSSVGSSTTLPDGISRESALSLILPVESDASYELEAQPGTEYTAPSDGWIRFEIANSSATTYAITAKSKDCLYESVAAPAGITVYKTIPVGKNLNFSFMIGSSSGSLSSIPTGVTITTKYFYTKGTDPNE
jgi:hypothetical protein